MAFPPAFARADEKIIERGKTFGSEASPDHDRKVEAMKKKRILVIDIGGSNVKLMISRRGKRRKFVSGKTLGPRKFIAETKKLIGDWKFDAIAMGFPSPVYKGKIMQDPKHLGKGWVGFDFRKAFHKPVWVVNDAAMQALGSYQGGRMLL